HDATVPHTLLLAPGLLIDKAYVGYWSGAVPRRIGCGRTSRTCSAASSPTSTLASTMSGRRGRRTRRSLTDDPRRAGGVRFLATRAAGRSACPARWCSQTRAAHSPRRAVLAGSAHCRYGACALPHTPARPHHGTE